MQVSTTYDTIARAMQCISNDDARESLFMVREYQLEPKACEVKAQASQRAASFSAADTSIDALMPPMQVLASVWRCSHFLCAMDQGSQKPDACE